MRKGEDMRILVVEDEKYLAEALSQILSQNNYTVDISFDGEDGLDNALSGIYDAVILDVMLPKMNGFDIVKTLRSEKISTPVILLTAKSDVEDRIRGLDCGADDYLPKPFDTGELLARLRALIRRGGEMIVNNNELSIGDVCLNTATMLLSGKLREASLTKKEFELLEYLIVNKSMVVSKEQIIEKLWGFDSEAEANHVEVYISFLRKKLAFVSDRVTIATMRGIGYRIRSEEND